MSKKNLSGSGTSASHLVLVTRPLRLPYGWASAVVAGGRLLAVEWEGERARLRRATEARYPGAETIDARDDGAGRYLQAYAEGVPLGPIGDDGIAIAWERVGEFDRAVLRATAAVPYGVTAAYGDIAARAGRPGAARAAGAALSRNPWPVIVPCHRVVGARGGLVGFGKGIAAKRALLIFESAALPRTGRAQ